jgi:tetratricopeptide (TPR) repeat protein
MDIKKIFIDGLYNIQNNNFEIDVETLNKFIENYKTEILVILENQNVQEQVSKTINFLHLEKKNYLLSVPYLRILCEKFPNNTEIRFIIAKTYYHCGLYPLALVSIESIPKKNYLLEHYQVLINIYLKTKSFQKCLEATEQIRLLEKINKTNTLIMIKCYLGLKKILEAKKELENLKNLNEDKNEIINHEISEIETELQKHIS